MAVESAAEAIPFTGGACEKGLAVVALLKESLEAELILHHRCPALGLFAGDEPETAGGRIEFVEDGPIKVGGSFVSAVNPAEVGEDFQVSADGGLRELEDVAEFGYA